MLYPWVLFAHLLGATIWTGGHLVLAMGILPVALRDRDVAVIRDFEGRFELIGIPALLAQVASGIYLAAFRRPPSEWFAGDPIANLILVKLGLLALTAAFAVDARLRIIPKLSPDRLTALAAHVIPVTVISVAFVFVGMSFRFGRLF